MVVSNNTNNNSTTILSTSHNNFNYTNSNSFRSDKKASLFSFKNKDYNQMFYFQILIFFSSSFFQEQLRRRKEEEDRIAQQNEFLRASLRGSRKLQALQDGPLFVERPSGVDNDAYTDDEDVEKIIGNLNKFNYQFNNRINKIFVTERIQKRISVLFQ